jgi:TRAP-type C4-dicarboxylate transport system substrate-binding protein
LSPDLQAVVVDAAKIATAEQRQLSGANQQVIIDNLKSKGMQVNSVTDTAAFRTAVQPMYEKAKQTVGDQLMQQTLNAVK